MGLNVGHYLGKEELPFGPKTTGINGVGNITLRDSPKLDEKAFTLAMDILYTAILAFYFFISPSLLPLLSGL